MRLSPRQPDASVNVSKTHPLAEAGVLVFGLAGFFVGATVCIVFAVDLLLRFVPPEKEVHWLSEWSPIEATAGDTVTPPQLDELLARLSRHFDTNYTFRIVIDPNTEPNAMAVPGGLIVLSRGLLEAIESENELAFVLGHELGHFVERDHIRQLGRVTALALIFGAISTSGGGDIGLSVSDLTLRGFGREQESKADAFGLSLLHAEYGHVADAGAFFARIERASGVLDRYVGTHPMPEDRIGALGEMAREQGWATDGEVTPWETPDQGFLLP